MRIADYDLLRIKIKAELDGRDKLIEELEYKQVILTRNKFWEKVMFGMCVGAPIFFLLPIAIGALTLTMIPGVLIPIINGVAALAGGFIFQKSIYKKRKYKEKMTNFCNAKTEKEVREELVYTEIEIAKHIAYVEALKKLYVYCTEEIEVLTRISEKYEILNKNKPELTVEEQKEKVEKSNQDFSSTIKNLNVWATKKYLSKQFRLVGYDFSYNSNPYMYGLLGLAGGTVFNSLPHAVVKNYFDNYAPSLIGIYAPALIAGPVVFYACKKSYKIDREILEELNEDLGEEKVIFDDSLNWKTEEYYENAKNYIVDSRINLEREKVLLRSLEEL